MSVSSLKERPFKATLRYVRRNTDGTVLCKASISVLTFGSSDGSNHRRRQRRRLAESVSYSDDEAEEGSDEDDEANDDGDDEDKDAAVVVNDSRASVRVFLLVPLSLSDNKKLLPVSTQWLQYRCVGVASMPDVLVCDETYRVVRCSVYGVARLISDDRILPTYEQLRAALRDQQIGAPKTLFKKYNKKQHALSVDACHMRYVMKTYAPSNIQWIVDKLYRAAIGVQRRDATYYALLAFYPEHAVRRLNSTECTFVASLICRQPLLMCLFDAVVHYSRTADERLRAPSQIGKLVWSWQQYNSDQFHIAWQQLRHFVGVGQSVSTAVLRRIVLRDNAAVVLQYKGHVPRFSAEWSSDVKVEHRLCRIAATAWHVVRRMRRYERGSMMMTRDELLTAVEAELPGGDDDDAVSWADIERTLMDERLPVLSYNVNGDAVLPAHVVGTERIVVDSVLRLFACRGVEVQLLHTEGVHYGTSLARTLGQRCRRTLFLCQQPWSAEALRCSSGGLLNAMTLQQCIVVLLQQWEQRHDDDHEADHTGSTTLVIDCAHALECTQWSAIVGVLMQRYVFLFGSVVERVLFVGDIWHPRPTPFVVLAKQCPWLIGSVVAQPHVVTTTTAHSPFIVAALRQHRTLCTASVALLRRWISDTLRADGTNRMPTTSDDHDAMVQLVISEIPERDGASWIMAPTTGPGTGADRWVMCTSRSMRRRVMDVVHRQRGDVDDNVWCTGMMVRNRDTGVVWRLGAVYDHLQRCSVERFWSSLSENISYRNDPHASEDGAMRRFCATTIENAECLCTATADEGIDVAAAPVGVVCLLVDEDTTLRDVALAARYANERLVLVIDSMRSLVELVEHGRRLPDTDLEQRLAAVRSVLL